MLHLCRLVAFKKWSDCPASVSHELDKVASVSNISPSVIGAHWQACTSVLQFGEIEMNQKFDGGPFVLTYPVFFLLNPTPPVSFVTSPLLDGPGNHGIYVFTDEAAADEYLENNDVPVGVIKHAAENRQTFIGKLKILLEQDDMTHLIVDERGGEQPKYMRCIPIKEIVNALN